MSIFYTYILRDPRNFEPIYVGKGKDGRMLKHWANMLCGRPCGLVKLYRKLTSIFRHGYSAPIYEKLLECEDEQACLLMERFMIKTIGRENLCNATDGGGGIAGYKFSAESCQQMRERLLGNKFWLGKKHKPETRQKQSEAHRGEKSYMFGKHHSEEIRKRIGDAQRGKTVSAEALKNMSGRVMTESNRQKMSVLHRGKVVSPEARQKISAARTGSTMPESTRLAIRKANAGSVRTPETRRKMSEANVKRWSSVEAKLENVPCGLS